MTPLEKFKKEIKKLDLTNDQYYKVLLSAIDLYHEESKMAMESIIQIYKQK